jgi:hypothetical protein
MEYLIAAIIVYFILQTAGNLVYILRGGGGQRESSASSAPGHNWKGPSPRKHMEGVTDHPTFWGQDIEEASWHDVGE